MEDNRIKTVIRADDTRHNEDSNEQKHNPAEYNAPGGEVVPAGIAIREIADAVRAVLSEVRVYVLESDITDAQSAVKAIVERSSF